MSSSEVDSVFVDAFRENFIAHLQKEYDPSGPENQAQQMVSQAIELGDSGKISRLFDALPLPIVDEQTFFERVEQAGSVANYIQPTLQQIAGVLLSEDQSRLSDEAINAIGQDKYCQLVGGKVEDGIIVADGDQTQFDDKQKEIARQAMTSIILGYTQSANKYELSAQDRNVQQINSNVLTPVLERIQATEYFDRSWNQNLPATTADNFENQANSLAQKANAIINSDPINTNELKEIYQQCRSLRITGQNIYEPQVQNFTMKYSFPFQQMATNFQLEDINKVAQPVKSLQQIEDDIEALYTATQEAIKDLERITQGDNEQEKNLAANQITAFSFVQGSLSTAKDAKTALEGLPEDVLREKMLVEYNKAKDNYDLIDRRLIQKGHDIRAADELQELQELHENMTNFIKVLNEIETSIPSDESQENQANKEIKQIISNFRSSLECAIPTESNIPDSQRLDTIKTKITEASNNFLQEIQQKSLIEKPKPANIIFRILRFPFIGFKLHSATEKAAKQNYEAAQKTAQAFGSVKEAAEDIQAKGSPSPKKIDSFRQFKSNVSAHKESEADADKENQQQQQDYSRPEAGG